MPPKKQQRESVDSKPVEAFQTIEEPEEDNTPQEGNSRFEYKNGSVYEGNWKIVDKRKLKNGHGKMALPPTEIGEGETYDGDWENNMMHGEGRYQFNSGAVYVGHWKDNKMCGVGKINYTNGTWYQGQFANNEYHGEGVYQDHEDRLWEGIFIHG